MSVPFLREEGDAVWLAVKVQPRASMNEVAGAQGEALRIRLTAPPVEGAANEELVRFLARVLECPRRQIELVRGHRSRHKVVRIPGMTASAVASKLLKSGQPD
ncbi:MAG TPA: DUF167 domain-containing protein [Verrucomicrobiota bacterium]|nr:DUF167 domain-containing protein [Verrucomicrobiota bacterium]HNU52370.1 DUF167 domain-containing protein [Verrucomicrobiota bacterium]